MKIKPDNENCWWSTEQQGLSFIADENQNSFEDSVVVSYKPKHHLTVQPSNCAARYVSTWFENLSMAVYAHTQMGTWKIETCSTKLPQTFHL